MTTTALTWHVSGGLAKAGTSLANFWTDLNAMFTANAADPNFNWEVASYNINTDDTYNIVLKRKDASDGRILLVSWTSAHQHPTLVNANPQTNFLYVTYFPNGNTDNADNLELTSGTILGDDTAALQVANCYDIASWATGSQLYYYADSEDGILLWAQNPASPNALYFAGAGELVVDGSDNAYACCFGSSSAVLSNWGANTTPFPFNNSVVTPPATDNSGQGFLRSHFGATNRQYFTPYGHSFSGATGLANPMRDDSVSKVYFEPMLLQPYVRGVGAVLKFRQIACGPNQIASLQEVNITGPEVAAISLNAYAGTASGHPWVTNFKV